MLKLVIASLFVALALGASKWQWTYTKTQINCVFLIIAIPEQPFEFDPEWSGRIVGGSTAAANQFRYQASLRGSAATAGQ